LGGGGVGQDHMHPHLYDIMHSHSTAFLHGRRLPCALLHKENFKQIAYKLLYTSVCLY